MKIIIFLVVLILFGFSIYSLCNRKGSCENDSSKPKEKSRKYQEGSKEPASSIQQKC